MSAKDKQDAPNEKKLQPEQLWRRLPDVGQKPKPRSGEFGIRTPTTRTRQPRSMSCANTLV